MSKFKFAIALALIVAVVVPMALVSAQAPETIVYASMQGDPIPKAFDEKVVAMWNEEHPLNPVVRQCHI